MKVLCELSQGSYDIATFEFHSNKISFCSILGYWAEKHNPNISAGISVHTLKFSFSLCWMASETQ